jgi:hypothetical protein
MSREIIINKYEGNTVYSVRVVDSYGVETHLGYLLQVLSHFPTITHCVHE